MFAGNPTPEVNDLRKAIPQSYDVIRVFNEDESLGHPSGQHEHREVIEEPDERRYLFEFGNWSSLREPLG